MKKFLSVLMLGALLLSVPFEAFARTEGTDFPGVLVAAARTKKKALTKKKSVKKQNGSVMSLSLKQAQEFYKIFEKGSLQDLKTKLDKENISVNATYRNKEQNADDSLLTLAAEITTNADIVKFLLSKGADVNKKSIGIKDFGGDIFIVDNMTALMKASICYEKSRPEIVKALIDAGAYVNAKDSENMTALDLVVESSQLSGYSIKEIKEVVKILLDAGADARDSLSHAFSDQGIVPEVLKMLLDAGAKVEDDLLMMAAINTEYPEVIELLLNAGANPKAKSEMEDFIGMRPIELARQNPNLKGTKALKMLEEASK